MSTRYCTKCKKIFDDAASILYQNNYYCPTCEVSLIYFGRAKASLSDESVINSYDAMHPFDPVGDYHGIYKNYGSVEDNIGFLECEDIIKSDPTNKSALLYLAKYHWSKQRAKQTLYFLERSLLHHQFDEAEFMFYVRALIANKAFKQLLTSLKANKSICSAFFLKHHQAIACLGLGHFQKAAKFFYHSYHLTENKQRKEKLKGIIRLINSKQAS